jgi:Tfp pilus assembly protein PilF
MRGAKIAGAVLLVLACQSPEERLAEHVQRAETYYESKEWEEAKIEFLNVLQLDPDNADAHFKMGDTLWELREYAEARWQYKETVRLDPENLEARIKLAEVELSFQRRRDATTQVEAILERDPENVEGLLLRGVLASSKGDLDALLADLDAALAVDPSHERALRLRARALEAKRQHEDAEAAYRRLLEVAPSSRNHVHLALFLAGRDRAGEALEHYQAAVELAETPEQRTSAHLLLANFHLNQRDPEAAEKALLAAREEAPDNGELLVSLARFYVGQGQAARAEEMLELRVEQQPDNVEPLLLLADFHRRSGDPEKALAALERALVVEPTAELARLRKAEYLMEKASADPELEKEARALLAQVLEENPNSVRGFFTQAKFLIRDRRYTEATAKLRRVIDEQPTSNAFLLLGTSYLAMQELELARSEFLRALQLDANNLLARIQLAALYLRTGERELAAQEARTALQSSPGDPRLVLVLADALIGLKRPEEAREALEGIRIPEDDPNRASWQIARARLYRMLGAVDRSREVLAVAAEERPGDTTVIAEYVAADLAERDPAGALSRLDKAIEANPDAADLLELRGRVRLGFRRGKDLILGKEAEEDLKAAIEKDPSRQDAYMLLAGLYAGTKRLDEAVETYESAREADPTNPRIHLLLGTLYEQLGRPEAAMESYEGVLRVDPRQPVAKNNLAWLIVKLQGDDPAKLDRALELAQSAKELMPDNPSVADTLGWVLLQKGAPGAAIPLFKEAIEKYPPGDPIRAVIRYHLAQAYERNRDLARAVEELEEALAEAESFPERSKAEELLARLKAG